MNTWYLIATPDNRKKYGLRMLTKSIFSFNKVNQTLKLLKRTYPKNKILVLKRTCKIVKEIE